MDICGWSETIKLIYLKYFIWNMSTTTTQLTWQLWQKLPKYYLQECSNLVVSQSGNQTLLETQLLWKQQFSLDDKGFLSEKLYLTELGTGLSTLIWLTSSSFSNQWEGSFSLNFSEYSFSIWWDHTPFDLSPINRFRYLHISEFLTTYPVFQWLF